jgi:hypothetical protein
VPSILDRLEERKAAADASPPDFVPDTTASLPDRIAALVAAKVRRLESDMAAGIEVPVLELQRLADQVSGKSSEHKPQAEDEDEYDLSRLDAGETATLHALLEKARR